MAIDDVYRLSIIAGGPAGQLINTYHFRMKTAPNPTEAQWNTVATDCKEIYRLLQQNSTVYNMWRAVQVRGLDVSYTARPCKATGGALFEAIFTTLTSGGASNFDDLPHQCAQVTTLRTAQVGRTRRGRIYAFGFSEQDQDAGVWTGTLTTAITTAWATFLGKYGNNSPTDPNFQLGVWSNRLATGCTPGPDGRLQPGASTPSPEAAFAAVTTSVVRNIVRTQRRRVAGVGS
jgi:hypothetical protein